MFVLVMLLVIINRFKVFVFVGLFILDWDVVFLEVFYVGWFGDEL